MRTNRLRSVLIAAVLVASLLPTTSALALPHADPTSVTVAGSLQSEAGCPADWDPACATTHLAYDANDDVWQGTFNNLPAGDYEYKAALNDAWDRELRAPRRPGRRQHPAQPAIRHERQVLLRPQEPLDHRQPGLDDRRGPGQLPVRAGLLRRLGSGLPAVLAAGHRRRRHLHVRDDRAAGRLVRGQGRDQRGLGRELRRRRRPQRVEHRLHRPLRRHEGHLHLRRDDARPHDRGRRRSWRARRPGRAVALRPGPQGLPGHGPEHRRRRSGTRSPAGSSATSTTRPSTTPTSRPSSTSSRTARPSPTSRPAT